MQRKYETLLVIVLSILVGILALWKVFLHVGYIYQRDSYPAYYLTSRNLALSLLQFPGIMDNVYMPVVILLYFNLISPEVADWISYFLFPFALAFPSMYFASRYFLNKFTDAKDRVKVAASTIVALFYSISPTAYYFSHWSNYAAFYALLPALIAGTFYSLEKRGIIGAFLLSLFSSLTTTDPRGFIFTLFIVLTVLLYRHKKADLITFLLSIPFYVLLNSRLFLYLLINLHSYVSYGYGISNVQLWLNYYTFNLLDSLRGLSLFRPLTSYLSFYGTPLSHVNPLIVYVFSFAFVELGLLGYIFLKKRSIATYFLLLYLFLVLIVSSNFYFLNYNVTLNILYPVWGYLAQTLLYPYLWIFLPTYISEMILAPLYLLVALVLAKILERYYFIPLVALICLAQFSFSASFVLSGNYQGQYNPVNPPSSVVELGKFLESHTDGNVFVNASSPYNGFLQFLPNVTNASFYNTSKIGVILNEAGVQYVVTTENNTYVESIINSHKGVFTLVYNNSGFLAYKNNYFTYHIISPVYVNFNSTTIPPTNESLNVIPSYLIFNIPSKYIGGYLGNVSYAELLALSAYKQGIDPLTLKVKHLPSYTNFTDTIYVNVYDQEILSKYPGISFIGVGEPSSLNLDVASGYYKVVLVYVSVPGGGTFTITNGSSLLSVSTSAPNVSVNFSYLGEIYVSKEAKLMFNGNQASYLLDVMFIPNNITLLTQFANEPISSYPSAYGRALGTAYTPSSFIPVLVNVITFLITILIFLGREKILIIIKRGKTNI